MPDLIPPTELRQAALLARVSLLLASARAYGFVDGGPDVDVDRCEEVIEVAREAGMEPTDDEVDAALVEFVGEVLHG